MACYEYTNQAGERREIVASMKAPPPERVMFKASGEWMPVPTLNGVEMPYRESLATASPALEVWTRVYAVGLQVAVPDHAVNHHGLPVSKSLPRRKVRLPDGSWAGKPDKLAGHDVLRHKDGGYTTMNGQPIVTNRADAARETARTGMPRD